MTYRERRQRRAERLREWAAKREAGAAAVFKSHEAFRGDIAFNTQPGRIPFRERMNAADDRAYASLQKAASMSSRADNIEAAMDSSIYSDDEDAVERLEARIADLEAQRERYKAYNASARKGQADESLLDDHQRAELASTRKYAPYLMKASGQFPAYVLSNLSGNISRQRQRLELLKRQREVA